jgi:hypothetical protein
MDQEDLIDVNGGDGSITTLVDNSWGQGVVALTPAMILSVRERRNIKLTDLCIGIGSLVHNSHEHDE